jgi:hypothetical protein
MRYEDVAKECEKRVGVGEFPLVARRFFARLQRLVMQHGDGALMIIHGCLDESQGPNIRHKCKYFGFTCKRRLQEGGYELVQDGKDAPVQTVRPAVQALGAKLATPPAELPDSRLVAEVERLRLSNEMLKRDLDRAKRAAEGGAF